MWYLLGFLSIIAGILFLCSGSSTQGESFFIKCDRDRSYSISKAEWSACFAAEDSSASSSILNDENTDDIFRLIDKNNDFSISLQEYGALQSNLLKTKAPSLQREERNDGRHKEREDEKDDDRDEDTVTVKMRNGAYTKMSKADLLQQMEQRGKGFRKTKSDNIVKEESYERMQIPQLEKDNPSLLKMIRLGNTSFEILVMMNHTDGKLIRIQTLKDPDVFPVGTQRVFMTKEEEEDVYINYHKSSILSGNGLTFYLELTVERLSKSIEYYEVHLEYNVSKYIPPHIAMVRAIRKDSDKTAGIALQVPPLPLKRDESQRPGIKSSIQQILSEFLLSSNYLQFLQHWEKLKKFEKANVIITVFAGLGFLFSTLLFIYFQLCDLTFSEEVSKMQKQDEAELEQERKTRRKQE